MPLSFDIAEWETPIQICRIPLLQCHNTLRSFRLQLLHRIHDDEFVELSDLVKSFGTHYPLLEELDIHSPNRTAPDFCVFPPGRIEDHLFPRLRVVRMSGLKLPWLSIPFQGLSVLRIDFPSRDISSGMPRLIHLLNILEEMLNLSVLEIFTYWYDARPVFEADLAITASSYNSKLISLPRLTSLRLNVEVRACVVLRHCLKIPSNAYVDISPNNIVKDEDPEALASLFVPDPTCIIGDSITLRTARVSSSYNLQVSATTEQDLNKDTHLLHCDLLWGASDGSESSPVIFLRILCTTLFANLTHLEIPPWNLVLVTSSHQWRGTFGPLTNLRKLTYRARDGKVLHLFEALTADTTDILDGDQQVVILFPKLHTLRVHLWDERGVSLLEARQSSVSPLSVP